MRGLERGFDRACNRLGWKPHRTAAYVEIEAFIIWNLVKKMEQGVLDAAPIWSNVKTFNGNPFRGKIHGIFGGYPCQPFSLAGERKGTEDPRHLWPYISGIIESVRPVFCFFENVSGHLSMGSPEVYRSLRDLGYKVEAGIFTAEEVGAPHERERLFILAIKNELVDTDGPRRGQSFGTISNEQEQFTIKCDCKGDRWPAGPGEYQYDWEPPRVESRMGDMFNGYNFREDLLRMAGNGVVEQTAELAFIDLLKKFKF